MWGIELRCLKILPVWHRRHHDLIFILAFLRDQQNLGLQSSRGPPEDTELTVFVETDMSKYYQLCKMEMVAE